MSLLPDDRQTTYSDDHYSASYDVTTATFYMIGEVDETDTERLRDDLRFLLEQYPSSLTIDLSAVTYLPSRAIGVVIGAQKVARARGTEIHMRTSRDSITAKVLTIMGLPVETT